MIDPVIVAAWIAASGSVLAAGIGGIIVLSVRKNRRTAEGAIQKLDTGNGSEIGPTVHGIQQSVEIMVGNQHLQTATLAEHGRKLEELTTGMRVQGDMITDQRLEQEQFVAKVSPLCDWVERKQQEEETA